MNHTQKSWISLVVAISFGILIYFISPMIITPVPVPEGYIPQGNNPDVLIRSILTPDVIAICCVFLMFHASMVILTILENNKVTEVKTV